jgi:YjbE family integral membrane protein
MEAFFLAIFNIVILDLVLSGDNAVVIGMAVRRLPTRQKQLAILTGGGLAIGLRISLTAIASVLLQVPLLQLIGGLVLIWITYHLLTEGDGHEPATRIKESSSLWNALRTIIIADVTMSTDNVLAVGAAAHGDLLLLLFGLTLSMVILVLGGTLVSALMNKLPWLTYAGAGVLIVLSGEMIASDKWLLNNGVLPHAWWMPWLFATASCAFVAGLVYRRRKRARPAASAPHGEATPTVISNS